MLCAHLQQAPLAVRASSAPVTFLQASILPLTSAAPVRRERISTGMATENFTCGLCLTAEATVTPDCCRQGGARFCADCLWNLLQVRTQHICMPPMTAHCITYSGPAYERPVPVLSFVQPPREPPLGGGRRRQYTSCTSHSSQRQLRHLWQDGSSASTRTECYGCAPVGSG